jgi:RNA polymerase sigma factor (TIGR02999 family)
MLTWHHSIRFVPDELFVSEVAAPAVQRARATKHHLHHNTDRLSGLDVLPASFTMRVVSDITRILNSIERGDLKAADELLPLIYAELRRLAAAKMAREQPGHTLQATALVHEAWLRLGDGVFANRAHFFAAASEAMRRILVERARRKHREKRGGGAEHVDVDELEIAAPPGNEDESLAVDEALDRLAAHDARKAEVVKLRYFVGFSFEETAEVLGISLPTAKRDWAYARAWLHQEIGPDRRPLLD